MLKKAVISLFAMGLMISNSEARSHHHHLSYRTSYHSFHHRNLIQNSSQYTQQLTEQSSGNWFGPIQSFTTNLAHSVLNVAHPAFAWCGWWMREHIGQQLHRTIPSDYNQAIAWAHFGHAAPGPAPGVIGVKRHHVVQVVKVLGPGRILAISGNDGHKVKTRERSTAGIIAWRYPS